jgi:hypothetical protein
LELNSQDFGGRFLCLSPCCTFFLLVVGGWEDDDWGFVENSDTFFKLLLKEFVSECDKVWHLKLNFWSVDLYLLIVLILPEEGLW